MKRMQRVYLAEQEQADSKRHEGDALIDKILETRTILLCGEINKDCAERVIRQMLVLEQKGSEPIKIMIDSPGGDVDAGFAIFDMARFIQCPVWMIGMGLVASAGALILLSAPKERRVGLPNSHYLIHQPLSGLRGVATEIEIHARELEKTKERINKIIAEQTGQNIDKVMKDTDRDYWMSGEEALSYGLIARIVKTRDELGI